MWWGKCLCKASYLVCQVCSTHRVASLILVKRALSSIPPLSEGKAMRICSHTHTHTHKSIATPSSKPSSLVLFQKSMYRGRKHASNMHKVWCSFQSFDDHDDDHALYSSSLLEQFNVSSKVQVNTHKQHRRIFPSAYAPMRVCVQLYTASSLHVLDVVHTSSCCIERSIDRMY